MMRQEVLEDSLLVPFLPMRCLWNRWSMMTSV